MTKQACNLWDDHSLELHFPHTNTYFDRGQHNEIWWTIERDSRLERNQYIVPIVDWEHNQFNVKWYETHDEKNVFE